MALDILKLLNVAYQQGFENGVDKSINDVERRNSRILSLENAIYQAEQWFQEYEKYHIAKNTKESLDKAETNKVRREWLKERRLGNG